MKICSTTSLEGIPWEKVVVLHSVESFCLATSDGELGYRLATRISYPKTHRSLTHKKQYYFVTPLGAFPAPASLNMIISQYTRSPIEEVMLDTKTDSDHYVTFSLTFRSAETTVTRLRFEVPEDDRDPDTPQWKRSSAALYSKIFLEASGTIKDLPLLASVKRLHIYGPLDLGDQYWIASITERFGRLVESLGPLEELTVCRCDMRSYPFLHFVKSQVAYPPIKVLMISYPLNVLNGEFVEDPSAEMEERLRPWVGVVDCCGAV